MQVSAISAAAVLLFIWVIFQAVKRTRHASNSPLNGAADAHWSVKYSGAWIWWHRILEQDTKVVHQAHVRHGALVRLGPDEVSVNDVDGGLKPIYDGRMPKHEFYLLAMAYGHLPLVGIRDEEPHRAQKKLVAKPYGKTFMMANDEWHAERERRADDLVAGLRKMCADHSGAPDMELYDVLFAWAVATASRYVFGSDGALNYLRDIPRARRVREAYFKQRTYQFIAVFLPVPTKVWDWLGYQGEIEWIRQLQDKVQAARAQESRSSPPNESISVYDYMTQNLQALQGNAKDSSLDLWTKHKNARSSELQDHMIAGVDGTLLSLTACAYLLSQPENREWQDRLRNEMRSLRASDRYNDRELEKLPVLNAVVKELLRLYAASSGGLPRVVDKAALLGPQDNQITAPPGTQVHCQAHSLHRSAVFEDPDSFRPDRWLDSSAEKRKEMERWYWAFGSGSRVCIGQHLALGNLRVAVAAIWGQFETRATEKTELKMSWGVISLVQPTDGYYMRVHVRPVEQ